VQLDPSSEEFMFRKSMFMVAALAGAAVLTAPAPAHADLIIRVTSLDSSGGFIDSQFDLKPLSDPMPPASGQGAVFTGLGGGFNITIATNISVSANGTTSQSMTVNLSYTGPTGAGTSNQLVVEFLGTNYITPVSPPLAYITSNASPSSGTLQADSVTMVSGVSVTNAGLPGTAGDTSGLMGLTTGTGVMTSAATILTPNPVVGAGFNQSGSKFSFYQAITFKDFTTTGGGDISAGSFVTTVPAPAGLILMLTGVPALAVPAWLRRRKTAVGV